MATAKKAAATKKAPAEKKAVKHPVAHKAIARVRAAVEDGRLQLSDMITNANLHLQERIKLPIVTNENMEAYANNLKDEIVKRVEAGEIAAEKKGQQLWDHLTTLLAVPKKTEE